MLRRSSDSDKAVQMENPGESLKRLLGYLQPYRGKMILVMSLVVIAAILNTLAPWLLGIAIDDFIGVGDTNGLLQMAILIAAIYITMWGVQTIYGRTMATVAQKMLNTLREELFEHMQTLSMRFYDQESAGDLLSRLTNDMDNINILLSQNLVQFISSIATLIGVLIAMFLLNVWLALASLVIFPIMLFLMSKIMGNIGPAFRNQQASLGKLNGIIEEDLSGQRVIIAYGQQKKTIEEFAAANVDARETGVRAQILAGIMMPIMMGLNNIDLAVVVGVGGFMAISGVPGITVGLITTYTSYARQLSQPLTQMSNLFNSIVAALAGAQRIFDVLDTEPQVQDKANTIILNDIAGDVTFNNVDFSYTPGTPILKNVSLDAKPGETIALVGPTGAGKTTIINVLTRFYDIKDGTITIDGNEIRDVSQHSLRRQLGIVLQDTYLFSATVMENIRYGRLEATDEEVIAAAKMANAHGFIKRLPHSYDTMLSERASNLSQGQRQLLAIARAILAEPSILILDEATSSVDTRTEKLIQKGLLNLMEGRTSFVIAHRLSTIRDADQILVINDGEIIESGNHQSLLANKGFYHGLYTSQFKGTAVVV